MTIEKPVPAKDPKYGANKPTWTTLARVWAERLDVLPGRAGAETMEHGFTQGRQRARIRIRWRGDVDATMRLREGDALYQIIGGPAELGRREYLEVLCERYATDGTA